MSNEIRLADLVVDCPDAITLLSSLNYIFTSD